MMFKYMNNVYSRPWLHHLNLLFPPAKYLPIILEQNCFLIFLRVQYQKECLGDKKIKNRKKDSYINHVLCVCNHFSKTS